MPARPPAADLPDDEVVALLSVPPDEFVAARTSRVRALRAEGRRAEAAALAKLRKPVRLVWAVGELARRHPEAAAGAAHAAAAAEAVMAGGPGDVRAVLDDFRRAVADVLGHGRGIDGSIDRAELELALRTVLSDPGSREDWAAGRLLDMPGDDPAPADELAPRRARRAAAARGPGGGSRAGSASTTRATAGSERAEAAAEAERRAREAALAAARAEVEAARAALDVAASDREATAAVVVDLEAELSDLEQQLEELRAEVDEARRADREAGAAVAAATDRLAAAERTVGEVDQP